MALQVIQTGKSVTKLICSTQCSPDLIAGYKRATLKHGREEKGGID